MDPSVIAAMARWPGVPDVYGWLSLDGRGRWKLHPDGGAMDGSPGETITSPSILAFIGRNYAARQGRWYFQNGPQRVYVRLDAAPYVLRLDDRAQGLHTHTGLPVAQIREWWLDDDGRLYARTEHGPGMVEDRDLPALLERLRRADGADLSDALESPAGSPPMQASLDGGVPAPLWRATPAEIGARLGFDPDPRPPACAENTEPPVESRS